MKKDSIHWCVLTEYTSTLRGILAFLSSSITRHEDSLCYAKIKALKRYGLLETHFILDLNIKFIQFIEKKNIRNNIEKRKKNILEDILHFILSII